MDSHTNSQQVDLKSTFSNEMGRCAQSQASQHYYDMLQGRREQAAQSLSATAEIDVLIPDGHTQGAHLTIGYAGQLYEVAVPVECFPGSTFRVPLLVSQLVVKPSMDF